MPFALSLLLSLAVGLSTGSEVRVVDARGLVRALTRTPAAVAVTVSADVTPVLESTSAATPELKPSGVENGLAMFERIPPGNWTIKTTPPGLTPARVIMTPSDG